MCVKKQSMLVWRGLETDTRLPSAKGFEILNIQDAARTFLFEYRLNPHSDVQVLDVDSAEHMNESVV